MPAAREPRNGVGFFYVSAVSAASEHEQSAANSGAGKIVHSDKENGDPMDQGVRITWLFSLPASASIRA